ncbi:MAG: outer membrane beta-barrel protein [Bacteroidia bacterium]
MKKILLLLIVAVIAKPMLSQIDKSMRFGIRITPAINWMTPDNDKKVQKGGAVTKMGIGLVTEFKITDAAWFQTGIEYTGAGFKAKYQGSDSAYYLYKDDAIVKGEIKNDSVNGITPFIYSGGAIHRLTDRKYNIGYINIPITLKLKTKDIGGMTYFAQIGGNLFIKTSARGNDKGEATTYSYNSTTMVTTTSKSTFDLKKVDIGKSVNLFSACASIGGGAEYNMSGSTSLFFSIHYQHHFMNATKADSGYLLRSKTENNKTVVTEFSNAVKLRQIVLAIGIVF